MKLAPYRNADEENESETTVKQSQNTVVVCQYGVFVFFNIAHFSIKRVLNLVCASDFSLKKNSANFRIQLLHSATPLVRGVYCSASGKKTDDWLKTSQPKEKLGATRHNGALSEMLASACTQGQNITPRGWCKVYHVSMLTFALQGRLICKLFCEVERRWMSPLDTCRPPSCAVRLS